MKNRVAMVYCCKVQVAWAPGVFDFVLKSLSFCPGTTNKMMLSCVRVLDKYANMLNITIFDEESDSGIDGAAVLVWLVC